MKKILIVLILSGLLGGRIYGQSFHSLDEMLTNSLNLYCSSVINIEIVHPYICFADSHFNTMELPFPIIPSISYTGPLIPRKAYKTGVDIINVDIDVKMNQLIIYFQFEVEKRKKWFHYYSEIGNFSRYVYEFCSEEQGWKLIKVDSHSI